MLDEKTTPEMYAGVFSGTDYDVRDYPFLLMGCLRVLLENNSTNAAMFRECGGSLCVHDIVPYASCRSEALKIVRELILSGGNDDLGK